MDAKLISLVGLTGRKVAFTYNNTHREVTVSVVKQTAKGKHVLVCETPEGFKSFSHEKIESISVL